MRVFSVASSLGEPTDSVIWAAYELTQEPGRRAKHVAPVGMEMISSSLPLVLGSTSPRRRQLLERMGISLRVVPAATDEALSGVSPTEYLHTVVERKLRGVAAKLTAMPEQASVAGLLVADTIVVQDDQILGKPSGIAQARDMLRRLAGRQHEVLTRFALAHAHSPSTACQARTVRTRVWFRNLTSQQIDGYAQSGEGLDKAGAYAVQGLGAFAIERIDGCYWNVVGLPIGEVIDALLAARMLARFPLAGACADEPPK